LSPWVCAMFMGFAFLLGRMSAWAGIQKELARLQRAMSDHDKETQAIVDDAMKAVDDVLESLNR